MTDEPIRLYAQSSASMDQCTDESIHLTVTSPPYWNAIDYDIHAQEGEGAYHRKREYSSLGASYDEYLENIQNIFKEVSRVTVAGGFCAIVVGTLLDKGKHYPLPMDITIAMRDIGWEFHQDIIWNKVTGGVKRAGVFIQKPHMGYYYPNIMTEYILVFRKPGDKLRGAGASVAVDELFKKDIANNVWHIAPVPPNTIKHPCPFPEEIARRLVLLYSNEGDEVLDPFLGSGQTAVAAIRQGRRCVGYDIEGKYLTLTVSRLMPLPSVRKYNLIPGFSKLAMR